ncbi:sigma-70 family RNA polymerase sigma factor [Rurimicrobium arvi]|uniref:RNA polymerase sigma-70 region 2 domain-containing protein n=1 Tax=Rurimicrobium arvi TaxID=2049916 RepID=A0ABP8MIM0_9BACT
MQLPLLKEHQLLEGIARNDRKITEQVYRDNYRQVYAWVTAHSGDAEDAADVFQEAMTILFQKSQQEAFRLTCKIGTYLVAVSKFIWYKKLEQHNRRPDFTVAEDEENLDKLHAYEDDISIQEEREIHFEQLGLAMEELGEPCRSLLKAFYEEGRSMQEIAGAFGYTNPDNAKTQKYKCLNRLKKIFYTMKADQ